MTEPRVEAVRRPQWLVGPDLVPWSEVVDVLTTCRHYWIATTGGGGKPHTRPIDGIWMEDRLVLSCGRSPTLRNVAREPSVSVHPEQAEGTVVILEGTATHLVDPDEEALRLYEAKYSFAYAEYWHYGTIEVRPNRVYAWRVLGPTTTNSGTRFTF